MAATPEQTGCCEMRLTKLTPEDYSPRQAEIAARIAGPRGQVRGPFLCLLHSPELCDRVEALASYIRQDTALPEKLREFSQLIAARHWDAQDSWTSCVDRALAAGLPVDVIAALAERRVPDFQAEDERVFYHFCQELLETHFVSDAAFAEAQALFGDQALVDTVACLGNFSAMALHLNAFQVDPAPHKAPPFADVRNFVRV
jgi:4-carboxymuconolactone decarboxylase